ncbi:TPA: hypothetical protein ACPVZG_000006 [Vibrio parahaemolyticus]
MNSVPLSVLKSLQWIKSQSATLVAASGMSFVAIWLTKEGLGQQDVLFCLSAIYLVSLSAVMTRRAVTLVKVLLVLSSLVALIALYQGSVLLFGVALCVVVGSVQAVRDLFYVGLMSTYSKIAAKHEVNVSGVVATAMLIGVTISTVASPILGVLAEWSKNVYALALVSACIVFSVSECRGVSADGISKSNVVPSHLHFLSSLAFAVSLSTFYARYFLLPMGLIKLSELYGFGDYIFVVAGSLLGLVSLLGFAINAKKSSCVRTEMVKGLIMTLLTCFVLAASVTLLDGSCQSIASVLFVLTYLSLEYYSKVWTVTFVSRLNTMSESLPAPSSSYIVFSRYKALGGLLSFALAGVLVGSVSVEVIGLVFSSLVLAYCLPVIWVRLDEIKAA